MEGILSVSVGAHIAVRDLGSVAPEDWSAAHATFVYDTVLKDDAAQILDRDKAQQAADRMWAPHPSRQFK
jgi:hypothetical protein